jgi:hypothetical protein
MYVPHAEFKSDNTENLFLWRYMDFWKFPGYGKSLDVVFPGYCVVG